MRIIPAYRRVWTSVVARCWQRSGRHRRKTSAVRAFDRRANFCHWSSRRIHLHRVTRDINADLSGEAVRIPRRASVGAAARDEAVFIPLVAVTLAAAETGNVAQNIGPARGKLVNGLDYLGRRRSIGTCRHWGKRSSIAPHPIRLEWDRSRRRRGLRRLWRSRRCLRLCGRTIRNLFR